MKAVVVMPAYNAGKTIEDVFKRLPGEAVDRIEEYIIVDDGSRDDTQERVRNLSGEYNIKLLVHERNRGYGGAQKTGFDQALEDGADLVVLLHSDGQYAPEKILEMMKPIEDGVADVVGGSRILGGKALEGGMPLHRYYGNIFLSKLENIFFKLDITTYHSGYKAYSRKALERIPYNSYSESFYFDSEMLVGTKRANLPITEIPIPTRYAGEKTYLNSFTYGIGVLGVIVRYLLRKI
ncbi:MAG: glycosyltransferase [Candidatus Altiarchaeales archaeon]|nr:glycosyltransferase [Candidatus Altiarchaeales archaeon]MBD3417090.1 glycosyltransferase [Candidatus Altiarchaeales archaeon]